MPFDSSDRPWHGRAPAPHGGPSPGTRADPGGWDPLPRRIDRPAFLAALRARMARMERLAEEEPPSIPLCPEMERDLPGGLPRAALHEILSDGAGAGFAALLMARSGGTVVWIARTPDSGPPALAAFGLSPARLILARPGSHQDALWVAEEALRCPAVSAVLLAGEHPDADATRRLDLAAGTGGGIGLLLHGEGEDEGPSLAATRWRVAGRAGGSPHDLGDPQWRLELLRGRGRSQSWPVTWRSGLESLVIDDEPREEEEPRRTRRP